MLVDLIEKGLPEEIAFKAIDAPEGSARRQAARDFLLERLPPRIAPIEKLLTVKNQKQCLPVYRYPRQKCEQQPPGRIYTFLVIGETGSGKTTLLDAFANHLGAVRFSEKWRWKLVDESHIQAHTAQSQTTDITYYHLWDERDVEQKCHIRIIDTPGFGDTEGFEKDEQTVKKFSELFKSEEIQELDFILFVVKSAESRWSNRQQYIHNCIMELFGNDAAERFVLMCTFADGADPQCLEVLRSNMDWQDYFKFNNSALYADPGRGDPTTKFFWDLGMDSVERFLTFVVETSRFPMSLTLAKEVLQTRERMQTQAESSMKRIQYGINQLEYLHDLIEDMKQHEGDINSNKDYKFTQTKKIVKQRPLTSDETAYQWCTNCNQLCCQYCKWPQSAVQSPCTYFHNGGQCPCCPQKCNRESHTRQKHKDIEVDEQYTTELDGKKEAFEAAKLGLSTAEYSLAKKAQEVEALAKEVLDDMSKLKECRETLDKIALKKINHSSVNLFGQMIEEETRAKTKGYQARIAGLQRAKDRAEAIEKMVGATSIESLFPKYQAEIQRVISCTQAQKSAEGNSTNSRMVNNCSIM